MITKIIDKFNGILTRDNIGDMNSGLAKYNTTFGNDPFSNIGNLTWLETAIQIDSGASIITDLIVAAKTRLENGITYVYAIGHLGRLYKIQVNNPATYNPNYDTPILLATLSINSPTFKYGSSIQFFGAAEQIYIGHDIGVTRINFDGTNEAFVGSAGSYTANVPRPSVNFLGVTYWGNGANILAIDSTGLVSTYTKLSPGFPAGTFVRDLDVSPDGNYLQIIVSRLNSPDLTSTSQDTNSLSTGDSYRFMWNGIDTGYTSYESYNAYSLTSNMSFGPYSYTMGYDIGGAAIYSASTKIITLPNLISPNFGAMFSTGNMLGYSTPETSSDVLKGSLMFYGQYDQEIPKGLYRFLRLAAVNGTDVIQMPVCLVVSNLFYGSSAAGYTNNLVGSAKLYFSVLENDGTTKFYKFITVPTGSGTAIGGVYETQQETSIKLFRNVYKKRLKVYEIRVFSEGFVANNSFRIDLIGYDGNPIANASHTFTVGTNITAGTNYCKYNPTMSPQFSVGVRITNLGSVNWVCDKLEVDIDEVNA